MLNLLVTNYRCAVLAVLLAINKTLADCFISFHKFCGKFW